MGIGSIVNQVHRAFAQVYEHGGSRHNYKLSLRGERLNSHQQSMLIPVCGEHTADRYRDDATRVFTYLRETDKLREIKNVTVEQVSKAVTALIKEGKSIKTMNGYASALAHVALGIERLYPHRAGLSDELYKTVKETIAFNRDKLIDGPGRSAYPRLNELIGTLAQGSDARLVAEIVREVGIRHREMNNMRESEVAVKGQNAILPNNRLAVTAKGGQLLTSKPLPPELAAAVRAKIKEGVGVWRFSERTVTAHIAKAAKDTGQYESVRGVHAIRHNYVLNRLEELHLQGINDRQAAKIVSEEIGHHRIGEIKAYMK